MRQVDVTFLRQVFSKPAADLRQTLSSLYLCLSYCLKFRYVPYRLCPVSQHFLLAFGDAVDGLRVRHGNV